MTKIVYNDCYGGFGLSEQAYSRYKELKGIKADAEAIWYGDIPRADPALAQVVKELGEAANTRFSYLQIRELPPGTKYRIHEYDGTESVITIDEHEWETA